MLIVSGPLTLSGEVGAVHARDEPALPVAVLVDTLRLVLQGLIDLDDLARERREHVGDRLTDSSSP